MLKYFPHSCLETKTACTEQGRSETKNSRLVAFLYGSKSKNSKQTQTRLRLKHAIVFNEFLA